MNTEQQVVYLHLDDIIPNRFQPREIFDEKALKELAVSIKEHGIIQPIIVREINNNKYEIIAGERRYKASALAGMTTIPAIIRNLDDKEAAKVALLENLQRKNLNPMEEARTYQKIIELDGMTQDELAKTMGKSQSAVANKLRLLALSDEVQNALLKEEISERHARALLNLTNQEEQSKMLNKIIKEKMTVRSLEDEIKKMNMPKEDKIENEDDLNNLINPQPVSINNNENLKRDTSFLMNPFGNSDEIVNYGEIKDEDDDEEPVGNEGTDLFVNNAVDLEKLKEQSEDIGDITKEKEEPKEETLSSLDSLLNLSVPTEKEITPAEQALRESENKEYVNTEDYFSAPDIMSVNIPNANNNSQLGNMYNASAETKEKTFDSLIDFNKQEPNEINNNNNNNKEEHKNNSLGFALMNEAVQQEENSKYNVKEMVDAIRKTLQELESHGAKIDTDEMNFEDEYQILIKIDKNND